MMQEREGSDLILPHMLPLPQPWKCDGTQPEGTKKGGERAQEGNGQAPW